VPSYSDIVEKLPTGIVPRVIIEFDPAQQTITTGVRVFGFRVRNVEKRIERGKMRVVESRHEIIY
jgi:hypothetical protein